MWFLRHLQIIGEAARALAEDVRALASEVPWSKIVGMRNILVQGYFDIDTDIVWDAAIRDVPAIKPAVEQLLKTLEVRGPIIFSCPGRWFIVQPCEQIEGFRTWIVHEYAEVGTRIVWAIVPNGVPRLLEKCESIIEEEPQRGRNQKSSIQRWFGHTPHPNIPPAQRLTAR